MVEVKIFLEENEYERCSKIKEDLGLSWKDLVINGSNAMEKTWKRKK